MDITKQAVVSTATMHVKSATGEPLYADAERTQPVQIVFYGPGSIQAGVVEGRQTARALKRMQDNDGKITAPTHEERVAETAEDLATLTAKFVNLEYPPAGDAQGCELYAALYRDQALGFIARQGAKFQVDWANFKGGSAAS